MRILWYSALGPTGYGTQTELWTSWLADAGHDVAIAAYHLGGHKGEMLNGIPVYPPQLLPGSGTAILPYLARDHRADLTIILADFWTLETEMLARMPCKVVAWIPLDTRQISTIDYASLKRTGVTPIAMSRGGADVLKRAGWADPLYVPHGIDCQGTFYPVPAGDRGMLRRAYSLADDFRVGLNFNNLDPWRKAAPQQMRAFAAFHRRHPNSSLWVHTITPVRDSLDILIIAATEGIREVTHLSDQEMMQASAFTAEAMRLWYGQLDVLMNATAGEGFGLPGLEAQACGTPAILARNTTGPELAGLPALVADCDWLWNWNMNAWWNPPLGASLEKCLERAFKTSSFARGAVREHALRWDVPVVGPMWDDVLARLGGSDGHES